MIIDGIDTRSVRYHKRYLKPDYKPAENRNNVFSQILWNYLCLPLTLSSATASLVAGAVAGTNIFSGIPETGKHIPQT